MGAEYKRRPLTEFRIQLGIHVGPRPSSIEGGDVRGVIIRRDDLCANCGYELAAHDRGQCLFNNTRFVCDTRASTADVHFLDGVQNGTVMRFKCQALIDLWEELYLE